ncbi:hypothetical protein K0B04_01560 [Patescibacteria group bacterium]|nr:hypothetical protein [Patescibacteria group bacterium]
MDKKSPKSNLKFPVPDLMDIGDNLILTIRLFSDKGIKNWPKFVSAFIGLVYFLSPIDLFSEILMPGFPYPFLLDDLVVMYLCSVFFNRYCEKVYPKIFQSYSNDK